MRRKNGKSENDEELKKMHDYGKGYDAARDVTNVTETGRYK